MIGPNSFSAAAAAPAKCTSPPNSSVTGSPVGALLAPSGGTAIAVAWAATPVDGATAPAAPEAPPEDVPAGRPQPASVTPAIDRTSAAPAGPLQWPAERRPT